MKTSIEKSTQVPKLYCYKYIWKNKAGNLCVKYLVDTQEGHATFQKSVKESEEVVSCMREYQHEINFAYLNFTEPVKEEERKNEKI